MLPEFRYERRRRFVFADGARTAVMASIVNRKPQLCGVSRTSSITCFSKVVLALYSASLPTAERKERREQKAKFVYSIFNLPSAFFVQPTTNTGGGGSGNYLHDGKERLWWRTDCSRMFIVLYLLISYVKRMCFWLRLWEKVCICAVIHRDRFYDMIIDTSHSLCVNPTSAGAERRRTGYTQRSLNNTSKRTL